MSKADQQDNVGDGDIASDATANNATDTDGEARSLAESIVGNGWRLAGFALLCTFFIAATQLNTADRIAEQQRVAKLRALLEIVPAAKHDNDLLSDSLPLVETALGHRETEQLYLAKSQGRAHTLIYPAIARDGYSGDIRYVVGVNIADGTVAGVRVLNHRETPGLGDAIELRKSDWILDFNGKRLGDPATSEWTVKKDGGVFDGFTGATITPRALVQSVANTLNYHQQHSQRLLAAFQQAELDAASQAGD